MSRLRALIIGSTGQDGYFLTKALHSRGCFVGGVGRKEKNSQNHCDYYRSIDLSNPKLLTKLLDDFFPQEIYYLAAVHGVDGMLYESDVSLFEVNLTGLHVCLEYIRKKNSGCSLTYASSSKAKKPNQDGVISEESDEDHSTLYSISKNAASNLLRYYRSKYNLKLGIIWFFNHESELRGVDFFTTKMLSIIENVLNDHTYVGEIGSLDFYCDWGSAEQYMDLVAKISDTNRNEDFIFATGMSFNARELFHDLFLYYGFELGHHVKEIWVGKNKSCNDVKITANITKLVRQFPDVELLYGVELFKTILEKRNSLLKHG